MTRLMDVAQASADVATTSSRSAKKKRLAELLRSADRADVPAIVAWLSGELLQRRIGAGWASVAALPPPAETATLEVAAVNDTFSAMADASGPGSGTLRASLLARTLSAATEVEQTLVRGLLAGGLRQGALAGVMTDAIAVAAGVPVAAVRRALMLRGDLPAVAEAAMRGGADELESFRLEVGRALAPMLAQAATSVDDALDRLAGPVAFEAKLDGARIQIHKRGDEVHLYTRSLDDVSARLPRVTADVRRWPVAALVADGEIMWSAYAGDAAAGEQGGPNIYLFDVLHSGGEDYLDRPNAERRDALERLAVSAAPVDRLVTRDPTEARAFFDRMIARGYEGVVAKSVSAPYEAGRRGASWLKIKPVLTLDLVVLAVERGSGRRVGKLSNIHLGARDPTGGFVMLGKTFKGMTDAMLDWQTRRFTELAVGPTDGYVVNVRPEQVVEIALDGVQTSSRYPGKMALRFARVLRYRDDKTAAEADTLDAVRAIHQRGGAQTHDEGDNEEEDNDGGAG